MNLLSPTAPQLSTPAPIPLAHLLCYADYLAREDGIAGNALLARQRDVPWYQEQLGGPARISRIDAALLRRYTIECCVTEPVLPAGYERVEGGGIRLLPEPERLAASSEVLKLRREDAAAENFTGLSFLVVMILVLTLVAWMSPPELNLDGNPDRAPAAQQAAPERHAPSLAVSK